MYYPILNASSILDIFTYNNIITNGIFGPMLLLMVFATTYMTMENRGFHRTMPVSLMFTTIIASVMVILGMLNIIFVISLILLTGVALALMVAGKSG